jgi:hypothetical protein
MKSKSLLRAVILLFLIMGNCYAMTLSAPAITYQNQRGSLLTLIKTPASLDTPDVGTVSGTFETAVGSCKEDVGIPLLIAGFFNGSVISISANFPHCKSVVSMSGYMSNDGSYMELLWISSAQAQAPSGQNWDSNNIGSDTYRKISSR